MEYNSVNSEAFYKSTKTDQKFEKNKIEKISQPLPPCLVCGDSSSGIHFGAITCEACKVRQ